MGIVGRLLEKWGRFHLKAEGHRWRYGAMDEIEAGQPEAALASAREALALYAAIGHTLGEAASTKPRPCAMRCWRPRRATRIRSRGRASSSSARRADPG